MDRISSTLALVGLVRNQSLVVQVLQSAQAAFHVGLGAQACRRHRRSWQQRWCGAAAGPATRGGTAAPAAAGGGVAAAGGVVAAAAVAASCALLNASQSFR